MFEFVVGLILLFGVGSCIVEERCKPDKDGNVLKICKPYVEKVKANE